MIRTALFAVFALTVITAGIAMAGEAGESSGTDETGGTGDPAAVVEVKAPCMDKANQEALDACLQRVLDEGLKIVLPTCEDESGAALTGDALTDCQAKVAAYQKHVAKISGEPCYGLADESLAACEAGAQENSSGGSSKKKGLEKHEGTKMERMSDEDDEE
ncbi:MAG: hypothetical protein QGH45_25235 [Myxococcota bacterium]|nr:hypothetical protein [Myxococcota bacterium]